MEKGYCPQVEAPPYPGPPMNYGGVVPQPGPPMNYGGVVPQPGPPMNYGGVVPQPGPPMNYEPQPGFAPVAPPPVAYQAVPAAPATTVTHLVVTPQLQDVPGPALCPHCRQSVVTQIEHTAGLMTWAICGGLTLFGCFLCCCIPFCIDSCMDVEHRCPNCHRVIHLYKRMK